MEEMSRKSKKCLIFCFSYGIVYFVCVGNCAHDKTRMPITDRVPEKVIIYGISNHPV